MRWAGGLPRLATQQLSALWARGTCVASFEADIMVIVAHSGGAIVAAGAGKPNIVLTKEQKHDAPWLQKLPAQNPNDKSTDAPLHHAAFVHCVHSLWTNPDLCLTTQSWLNSRMAGPVDIDSDRFFVPEPLTLSNILVEWLAAYLIDLKVGWSEKLLGLMKAYDRSQILNLVCGYLNVSPMLKLGEHSADKLIVRHAFDLRRQPIDRRFDKVHDSRSAASFVDDVGQIKFGEMGIFCLEVNNQTKVAVNVTHCPSGAVAKTTSDNIDARWYLDKNYSESKAVVQMDGSRTDKHFLADYFAKGQGPHKHPMLVGGSPVWQRIMEEAAATVKRNRDMADDGVVPETSEQLHEAQKVAQQESAKRARERMAEKKADRSKRARLAVVMAEAQPLTPVIAGAVVAHETS